MEISSFYICVPKILIRWCTVPVIRWVTDVIVISHFGLFFAALPPKKSAKNIKILKKWKKGPRDIIILHMCTKNYDQMMYGSWDMVHDRCNCYFSFWAIFCPFAHLTAQKIKILKKMNKVHGDIIILHMFTKNYDQIMYGSWDMVHDSWTDGWTDRLTYRQTEGWTDRRMDRRLDGWRGWTDGKSDI